MVYHVTAKRSGSLFYFWRTPTPLTPPVSAVPSKLRSAAAGSAAISTILGPVDRYFSSQYLAAAPYAPQVRGLGELLRLAGHVYLWICARWRNACDEPASPHFCQQHPFRQRSSCHCGFIACAPSSVDDDVPAHHGRLRVPVTPPLVSDRDGTTVRRFSIVSQTPSTAAARSCMFSTEGPRGSNPAFGPAFGIGPCRCLG